MSVQYKYVGLVIGALAAAGCGSTEVHQVLLREPTMQPAPAIEMYVVGGKPPARPYYEVALLQAIGHGSDADVEDVTRAIANRGARLGCDAVVRVHVELGNTRAHASGVCVNWARVVVQAPAPAPQPAPTQTPQPEPTPTATDGTSI